MPLLQAYVDYCINIKFIDREDMLLYQGVIAFELFTDTKADKDLIEAMRRGLKES